MQNKTDYKILQVKLQTDEVFDLGRAAAVEGVTTLSEFARAAVTEKAQAVFAKAIKSAAVEKEPA